MERVRRRRDRCLARSVRPDHPRGREGDRRGSSRRLRRPPVPYRRSLRRTTRAIACSRSRWRARATATGRSCRTPPTRAPRPSAGTTPTASPGRSSRVTRGNNVHAYTDRDNNNVADPGSDPDGGPSLTFDFPLDLDARPLDSQPAVVTNLFYWNNIIHDVTHNYGFDEASGNFQVNNYGNGGLRQRRRPRRGAGRQRPQQRQLRHARRRRAGRGCRCSSGARRPRTRSSSTPARSPDGRSPARWPASARASSPLARSRARSSTSVAAATRPTRSAARADPARPVPREPGRQDRADRPRHLRVRRQGQEGRGRGRADGDRGEQHRRPGDRHGRRRSVDHDPVGDGQLDDGNMFRPNVAQRRHDLGRHGRRARPRLRPRQRRDRPRVRPRHLEPPHRRAERRSVPELERPPRADGRGLERLLRPRADHAARPTRPPRRAASART